MLRRVLALSVSLWALTCASCQFASITGSGNVVSKDLKLKDFDSISVSTTVKVHATKGDFAVTVKADDNLIDFVKVEQNGNELAIRFDMGKKNNALMMSKGSALEVHVSMPELKKFALSGATTGIVEGFESKGETQLNIEGASKIEGAIVAEKLIVHVKGASKATLKGSAKEVKVSAEGASTADLSALNADAADFKVRGASNAKAQVKTSIDYDVEGASNLEYSGEPKVGTEKVNGASKVKKVSAK
jgi:hypothetical protein